MKFWFLQPFPVPFPAPSLVGLLTTNSILFAVLLALGLFIPRLHAVLGSKPMKNPSVWLPASLGCSCIGLDILRIWGTLAELPVGFAWSAIYMAVVTVVLCLTRLSLRKKPSTDHHC
jgi:hypothetical protein